MKLINKYSFLAMLAIGVSCQLNAQAQVQTQAATLEPNTTTRTIDQYKNGTVPGMTFAPSKNNRPAAVETAPSPAQTSESQIDQIRKGTAPGMQFARGGGSSGVSTGAVANAPRGNGNLTSDKAAPIAVKTLTPVVAPSLPTQGDATPNTKAPAATKAVKTL